MNISYLLNKLPEIVYCERGREIGLFAEPLNAFTNGVYIIVAILSYKLLIKKKIKDIKFLFLPWIILAIGLGSFLYHTERNAVTLLFDSIPIFIFIVYTLFLLLRELCKKTATVFLVLLVFIAFVVFLSIYIPSNFMNGSIRHIATIAFVSVIFYLAIKKFGRNVVTPFIKVILLYASAIVFRSIDMSLCSFIPIGTHFLWHILAALTSYQAISLLITIKLQKSRSLP